MPDGYLLKKKTADEPVMQPEQLQQQEANEYLQNYQSFQEQSQELLTSERTVMKIFHRKDSAEMTNIKTALSELSSFYELEMSTNHLEFSRQLTSIQSKYDVLISYCNHYLTTKKNPHTSSGKARYNMVSRTLSQARMERNLLEDAAHSLYEKAAGTPILWANILQETRSARISIDQAVPDIGAGCSEVYRLPVGENSHVYFKPMETVPTLKMGDHVDAYHQKYKDRIEGIDDIYQIVKDNLNEAEGIGGMLPEHLPLLGIPFSGVIYTQEQVDRIMGIRSMRDNELIQSHPILKQAEQFNKFYAMIRAGAKEINTGYVCKDAKIKDKQTISQRNVATSRMAKMLGIGDLIAESRMANVKMGTMPELHGIIMKEAKGSSFSSLANAAEQHPLEYSPDLLRQLTTLQLFDALCGQVDRNESNFLFQYHEVENKRVAYALTGIDNDMAFGDLTYQDIVRGKNQLRAVQNNDELSSLPALDHDFYQHLLALNDETIDYLLKDLIPDESIAAFKDRLSGILKMLQDTITVNENFLIGNDAGWAYLAEQIAASGAPLDKTTYIHTRFVPK